MFTLLLLFACSPPPDKEADGFSWPEDDVPASDSTSPTRLVVERAWLPEALDLVAAATERVQLSSFLVIDQGRVSPLLEALTEAAARGVSCQILADGGEQATVDAMERLALQGCETRLDSPEVVTHTKLLLADDVALTGSHNLTDAALSRNVEASVRVQQPLVVADLRRAFESLWQAPEADVVLGAVEHDGLRVVADRELLPAMIGCLDAAEDEISGMIYAMAWDADYPGSEVDQLLAAVERAAARGLPVHLVVDGSDWSVDNRIDDAAIERLSDAGVSVRRSEADRVHHAKVLIADDCVVVSDANWSYSGLALYHGVSVVSGRQDLALATREWVRGLWEDAR